MMLKRMASLPSIEFQARSLAAWRHRNDVLSCCGFSVDRLAMQQSPMAEGVIQKLDLLRLPTDIGDSLSVACSACFPVSKIGLGQKFRFRALILAQ